MRASSFLVSWWRLPLLLLLLMHNKKLQFVSAVGSSSSSFNSSFSCSTRVPNRCEKVIMKRGDEIWRVNNNQGRSLLAETTTYTIKVWVWILRMDSTPQVGRLGKKFVNKILHYLNTAFAGSNFQFTLQKSRSKRNDLYHYCLGDFRSDFRKGDATTLNIYICDSLRFLQTVGYSSFPHEVTDEDDFLNDGVVLMNPKIFNGDQEQIYMTAVHEVGHWLGLLHTFTDGCSADSDNDGGSGDGVTDTAAHFMESWNYDGWEDCFQSRKVALDTCDDNDNDGQIDPGLDPVQNHMNYIHHDCMINHGEFTSGQHERMLAQFEMYRLTDERRRLLGLHFDIIPEPITEAQLATIITADGRVLSAADRRRGIQSTNDTHVFAACLEKTMEECGCDTECILKMELAVLIIT